MSRGRLLLTAVLVATGVAVGLFCCSAATERQPEPSTAPGAATEPGPGDERPQASPGSASAAAATGALVPPGAASPTASTAPPTLVAAPAASDAGSPPTSSVARAVANEDTRDLTLLSSIERELEQDPPPAVHALIRRRKEGASREELTRGARELPDLRLRVLVMRWVEAAFDGPDAGRAPPVPATSASGRSVLKPIAPAH